MPAVTPDAGSPGAEGASLDGRGLRVLGVPVRVEPLFFLVAVLLGWGLERDLPALAAWVAVVFVSVLWHELGHALALRAFGHRPRIELHGFGGATWAEDTAPTTRARRLVTSVADPAAGFALGGAVLAGSRVLGPLPGEGLPATAVGFAV